jgi:predicted MPP superfamily phosphohydrolase
MRRTLGSWIFIIIVLLLDIYIFQVIKMLTQSLQPRLRLGIHITYWFFSAAMIIFLMLMPYQHIENWPKSLRSYTFAIIIGLFLAKLLASVIFLVDDLRRVLQWTGGKLFYSLAGEEYKGITISRSVFLSWLGIGLGSLLFGSLVWGFRNKYRYKIQNLDLAYENLPSAFKGIKVIQISDIHSGSFMDKESVMHGVNMIMAQKPDLILFTGDLVNDRAIELKDYMDVFNQLNAPMGVYSTLGNHDYGDYYYGSDPEGDRAKEKIANLQSLKEVHGKLGWRLLMDEHVVLEKEGQQIALIGVQNISGKGRFHSYGDLKKAYLGAEKYPFKILMSHDPSHWDKEVRESYADIDLVLSGHTHGMQFGVEIPGIKWSPVQYMYKQWHGLYESGAQRLYVNPGFGFIGYPGRVGVMPEITVFRLV